jgi:hypothetical protein
MTETWFMTTVVCDDVRKEEGNKLSYMGIYGANIVVPTFPFTLPKLCFVMSLLGSGDHELPKSLVFRLFKDDDILAELSIPPDALTTAKTQFSQARDSTRVAIGTIFQVFPIQFASPCTLRARAIYDGVEVKGGSWPVESVPAELI